MFHIISEPGAQPYIVLVSGTVFVGLTYLLYSDNFSFSDYRKMFIRRTKKAGLAFNKFFKTLKRKLYKNRQFFYGAAFSAIVFTAFSFISAGGLSHFTETASIAPVASASVATKTTLDSSKAWKYDFSTQQNGALDSKIFNIENGPTKANYNNELETFTNRTDNVRVQDGVLVLEAKPENKDSKAYTSGRIDTHGSFSFTYGTLEIEAKLPKGNGTWPAAWLMPASPRYQAADFPSAIDQNRLYTLNGELDFLESVGYLHNQNIPAAHSYNSLAQGDQYTPGFTTNPYDEYHRYGIVKTPNLIEFTIDGKVYASRVKTSDDPLSWPFNQPYYLIINLSLGGKWAGKYGIDTSSAPWQYMIKSISYSPSTNLK